MLFYSRGQFRSINIWSQTRLQQSWILRKSVIWFTLLALIWPDSLGSLHSATASTHSLNLITLLTHLFTHSTPLNSLPLLLDSVTSLDPLSWLTRATHLTHLTLPQLSNLTHSTHSLDLIIQATHTWVTNSLHALIDWILLTHSIE